jgi:hypothetical protein
MLLQTLPVQQDGGQQWLMPRQEDLVNTVIRNSAHQMIKCTANEKAHNKRNNDVGGALRQFCRDRLVPVHPARISDPRTQPLKKS